MGSLHARMGTQKMRAYLACIDLGTNSIHLLVTSQKETSLVVHHDSSRVIRLGEGLRQTGMVGQAALARLQDALENYKTLLQPYENVTVIVTATSATREASNQTEVIQAIEDILPCTIEIIDKNLEAKFAFTSVTHGQSLERHMAVCDIGGGSTEIGWNKGDQIHGQSVAIGTVKLLESHLYHEHTSTHHLSAATQDIRHAFASFDPLPTLDLGYGTAGSFTQLAALDLSLEAYSAQRIDNHKLTKEAVESWIETLANTPLSQRLEIQGMHPDRADVALPGALLARELMRFLRTDTFQIRDRGIRFGRALHAYENITHIEYASTMAT